MAMATTPAARATKAKRKTAPNRIAVLSKPVGSWKPPLLLFPVPPPPPPELDDRTVRAALPDACWAGVELSTASKLKFQVPGEVGEQLN